MRRTIISLLLAFSSGTWALSSSEIDFSGIALGAQPNIVADPQGGFLLSWQTRDAKDCSRLHVARLSGEGKLGRVQTVASGCDWFVNWADMPSVVIADNGDWVSFWLQKSAKDTYAYDILSTRSIDRGAHWSKPLRPHRDATPTEHGFVSMAPAGADRVRLIWLDGRASAGGNDHAEHGQMTLRSAVLARENQISDESELDADVCSCCWPSLLRTGPDRFLAAYRDHTPAEIRDIALGRWQGGKWQMLGSLHDDGWEIAACPTNGPVLAGRANDVLAVWPTMADGVMAVRAKALSPNGGISSTLHELERGAGVLGRPSVAAFGKTDWLLSWLGAGAAGQSSLRVALWDKNFAEQARVDIRQLPAGRNIGVPKLAANGRVAVLVWTEVNGPTPTPPARAATRLAGVLLRP